MPNDAKSDPRHSFQFKPINNNMWVNIIKIILSQRGQSLLRWRQMVP